MRYKVGDRVQIKSLDWYNENKDKNGVVVLTTHLFTPGMSQFCGKVMTIEDVFEDIDDNVVYYMEEIDYDWTDEMIEGLVEEESANYSKVIDNGVSNPIIAKTSSATIDTDKGFYSYSDSEGNLEMEWNLPQGYQFVDENGNVINATKIVLEKKHNCKLKLESTKKVREYWNEYARIYIEIYEDEPNECVLTHLYTLEDYRQKGYGRQVLIEAESIAKELGCHTTYLKVETDSWMHKWYLRMGYKWYRTADEGYTWLAKNLTGMEKKKEYPKTFEECVHTLEGENRMSLEQMNAFRKLIDARNAYWKIAGEEMGLDKPWEPDCNSGNFIPAIIYRSGSIQKVEVRYRNAIFSFPTAEMRDAFKKNFDPDIEFCKELL